MQGHAASLHHLSPIHMHRQALAQTVTCLHVAGAPLGGCIACEAFAHHHVNVQTGQRRSSCSGTQGAPSSWCRGILGWLHNIQGRPLETLTFSAALPSSERAGVTIAFDYISWLNTEREINVRTEGLVVRWAQQCTQPAT